MPRTKRSRRSRPRRARRARGTGRSVPRRSLQFKNYSYRFTLQPQILINNATGSVGISASGAQLPINTSHISNALPSTGFDGYRDVGVSAAFKLTDCANSAAFTQLYDAYKINKVHLEIEYLSNVAATNTLGLMPTIWQYYDQDDFTTPISTVNTLGKQGVRKHHFGSDRTARVKFSFTPTTAVALANGVNPESSTVALAGVSRGPTWIDCASPEVAHYAYKAWIADMYTPIPATEGGAIPYVAMRFNWSYDVSFRSPITAY